MIGFKAPDGKITLHKHNCPDAIRLASQQGDTIVAENFEEDASILYPVRVRIRGVDRYHLLSDIVECITEKQYLSITRLFMETVDWIAECTIDFAVHSADELLSAMDQISTIKGVDEVSRIDIE